MPNHLCHTKPFRTRCSEKPVSSSRQDRRLSNGIAVRGDRRSLLYRFTLFSEVTGPRVASSNSPTNTLFGDCTGRAQDLHTTVHSVSVELLKPALSLGDLNKRKPKFLPAQEPPPSCRGSRSRAFIPVCQKDYSIRRTLIVAWILNYPPPNHGTEVRATPTCFSMTGMEGKSSPEPGRRNP